MSEPIRVLHVFAGLNCGGAENLVMNLYRRMDRTKIQFDFAYYIQTSDYFVHEIQEMGGRVHLLPPPTARNIFFFLFRWWQLLSKNKTYRIIHGHAQATSLVYLFFARLLRRNTILHAHTTHNGYGVKGLTRKIVQFPSRFLANTRLACSQEAGEWLFGNKKKFAVFSNAIDPDRFRYDPIVSKNQKERLGVGGRFVIGHVGRFSPEKNHAFILDILECVVAQDRQTVLLLAGDGPLKSMIEERVKKKGLVDHVVFAGFSPDVEKLMMAMDLYIFPSWYEGFPLTLIEAQCAGLPCLISDAISREVIKSPLVQRLSIQENRQRWVEKILEIKNQAQRQERGEWVSAFRNTCCDSRVQTIRYETIIGQIRDSRTLLFNEKKVRD